MGLPTYFWGFVGCGVKLFCQGVKFGGMFVFCRVAGQRKRWVNNSFGIGGKGGYKRVKEGPYKLTTVIIPAVPTTNDSLVVPKRTSVETLLNISPKNKAHYQSKKEAIHLLLTGIGDEIYSTVVACKTAHDMWIAIERLQQGTPPSGTPLLLPIPLPTSSPPFHLLSTDRRADRPEVTLPPRKMLGIALGPRYEVGESPSVPTARPPRGAPAIDDTELGRRMTEFATWVRQDTDEIYVRLDDEQTERQLMAGRLNMLYMDRRAHARTALVMEREARMRHVVITELLAADRRRQAQLIEALNLLKGLQTQMTEFQRQQGPAKGPAQPDAPEEAGSIS
ncbi:hypothetical protein Tco_0145025 [Tanacetum coccineum]